MNIFRKILIISACFNLFLLADPCYDESKISIRENFFSDDIIGYYLTAIDIDSGVSNVLIFDYSIDFSEAISSSSCGSSGLNGIDELYLDYRIDLFVPEYDSFSSGPTPLVEGTVRIYNIPPTLNELNFRNTDLSLDTSELQGGTSFQSVGDPEIHITSEEQDQLTETFLLLSRLPNGSYYFTFDLKGSETSSPFASITKEISIFVPTYIELITPGSPDISMADENASMTNNPVFQWNSDYCNNCELSIRVCEYREDDHSSLAEAIEDYSVLPLETGFHLIGSSSINSFQYPISDVGSLLDGKKYVWQLKRSYNTTNGINEEFSNIFIFSTPSTEVQQQSSFFSEENLNNLLLLIGEEKYNEFFGIDGQLEGYDIVEQVISVNGQDMSVNYLLELIEKLNNGEINILEVNVE